jgi:hypothetical protein
MFLARRWEGVYSEAGCGVVKNIQQYFDLGILIVAPSNSVSILFDTEKVLTVKYSECNTSDDIEM